MKRSFSIGSLLKSIGVSSDGSVGQAEALIKLGRLREANVLVAESYRHFPKDSRVRILEARRLLRRSDFDGARTLLEPLTRGRGEIAVEALSFLAAAELARGRRMPALALVSRALTLSPNHRVARRVRKLAETKNR